ncbi:MAG TPA: hypothetical protein VGG22_13245 [Candidatus Baltobacteraceae bacterium]
MVDRRRLNLARTATILFGIVAVTDVWRWLTTRNIDTFVIAAAFTAATVVWIAVCIRWSRQI